MTSRRKLVLSLAGGLLLPARALAAEAGIVKGRNGGPNMIKGNPPQLDFGGGLLIPMDGSIFKALWEGEDRWITYGHALSRQQVRAMGQAEDAAVGKMKLMLLTLAFAPERLERFAGLWLAAEVGEQRRLGQGRHRPARPPGPPHRGRGWRPGRRRDALGRVDGQLGLSRHHRLHGDEEGRLAGLHKAKGAAPLGSRAFFVSSELEGS